MGMVPRKDAAELMLLIIEISDFMREKFAKELTDVEGIVAGEAEDSRPDSDQAARPER
jgi:hypothetical protein